MDYDLELDTIVNKIKTEKAKTVLLQLPDGLKPQAGQIARYIEGKADARVLIWAGSCFGACDIPVEAQNLGVDLLVQLGHSEWK